MSEFKSKITGLLFPSRCLVCRRFIPDGYICDDCREKISNPLKEISYTISGGKTVDDESSDRAENISGTAFVLSAESYEGGYRKSLESFKFGGAYKLSFAFAGLMCDALENTLGEDPADYDYVTYVSMTRSAVRNRGYNQSQKLAESISELSGVRSEGLLLKTRRNYLQHDLSADDRKLNVKGVYSLKNPALVKGKRIILVDDIVTTGSTLAECTGMLYSAGAEKVQCLCAAQTPSQS